MLDDGSQPHPTTAWIRLFTKKSFAMDGICERRGVRRNSGNEKAGIKQGQSCGGRFWDACMRYDTRLEVSREVISNERSCSAFWACTAP